MAISSSLGCAHNGPNQGRVVNDIHSGLNETRVSRVANPRSIAEIQRIVKKAKVEGTAISITGGHHAMGGQQFGEGTVLVDMGRMNRVLSFDQQKGTIKVEAGIQWPGLVDYLIRVQKHQLQQWGIIQKQTGADRLSIGGALSANAHGRGLKNKPIIDQVESFDLVDAEGVLRHCSRSENYELFRLAIGGYGLFGVITDVTLRLGPRTKMERIVEVIHIKDLMTMFEKRMKDGFISGDFQYSIDKNSDDFLTLGVFPCYRPVANDRIIPDQQKWLHQNDWEELYYLAHTDPKKAFEKYSKFYLSTSGQIYWSDTQDLSTYKDHYHDDLDRRLGLKNKSSEMTTEIYVPRDKLVSFMDNIREDFRKFNVQVIYGTIRLIKKDEESFLNWARENYACVIFNLHVEHTPAGIEKAKEDFRRLIDRAISYGGSYYLTYHRWATKDQVKSCYPQFVDFLKMKLKYDPGERFQSEWWRYYREMFKSEVKN